MYTRHLMLAALLAGLFAPALAQDARAGRADPADGSVTIHFDSAREDARTGVTVLRVNAPKNVPYSAQVVTERTQALADGNGIATRRATMTYRDSAGRTRQEYRDGKGDVVTVTINDPVAGTSLVLHPRERTAVRIGGGPRPETMRTTDGSQQQFSRHRLADGSEEIIVKRVEGRNDAERQRDVRIQVPRAPDGNGDMLRDVQRQMVPLVNGAFADVKWSAKATTKDLGTRDIGGVKAEGKLRSYEIPVGEIGNRNPIVVSDETWTAPDLQVTVYTKHSDPRSGDFVFRLENVKREEPAAALFAIPADYTVRDVAGRRRGRNGAADGKVQ